MNTISEQLMEIYYHCCKSHTHKNHKPSFTASVNKYIWGIQNIIHIRGTFGLVYQNAFQWKILVDLAKFLLLRFFQICGLDSFGFQT